VTVDLMIAGLFLVLSMHIRLVRQRDKARCTLC